MTSSRWRSAIRLLARRMQRAIDVDRRKAERVPDLRLRDRKAEVVAVGEPDDLEPGVELADEVGEAFLGMSPADVDQPSPQDRLVDQRRPPESAGQRRPFRHFQDAGARGLDDLRRRQGRDAMVHGAQYEDVQVAEVGWNSNVTICRPA